MRHRSLTIDIGRMSKDLSVRSEAKFSKEETEAILTLPGVTGVLPSSAKRLLVGVAKTSDNKARDAERVKGEIVRVLTGEEGRDRW